MEAQVATTVECAPYLQRLILEDPDPSSPLYIPKAPPRSYQTLKQAIDKGLYVDNEETPLTPEASRGVNMRDSRAVRSRLTKDQKQEAKTRKEVAENRRRTEFTERDPFSMGEDPFGRGEDPFGRGEDPFGRGEPSPFGGRGDWGSGGDPFGGMDESPYNEQLFQDSRRFSMGKKAPKPDYDQEDEPEVTLEEMEPDQGEEVDDEAEYKHSVPIYEDEDAQLREDARRMRAEDDMRESGQQEQDNKEGTGYTRPAADGSSQEQPVAEETAPDGTGSEVQLGEEFRPKRKIKEEFMRDRAELEKRLNAQGDSLTRRGDDTPREVPPGADPDDLPPRSRSRILSGAAIKQQMAMQKLAAAALKAIAKGGKGKKGGGRVKVMFM